MRALLLSLALGLGTLVFSTGTPAQTQAPKDDGAVQTVAYRGWRGGWGRWGGWRGYYRGYYRPYWGGYYRSWYYPGYSSYYYGGYPYYYYGPGFSFWW